MLCAGEICRSRSVVVLFIFCGGLLNAYEGEFCGLGCYE